MFTFDINQNVIHEPTSTRARVVGLHKNRSGSHQIEIEYKTTTGEIQTNWVAEQELSLALSE
ncbi:hypothetical protein NH8B_1942 [Pseudogulbenkiania sp. NH8B]|uniref:hypothetical protein n=1 Tax=Pseudogulbenkiania sp. (strain NH8B) TaxID=748280 RepID=UPI0002279FE3|nr:hypothetical protein [Pseudogulbenkiania sp. NH8B]BAK76757.1 hypothetical protein NH8B_1942 [Pseudogulbenkiania sp. NH8B]